MEEFKIAWKITLLLSLITSVKAQCSATLSPAGTYNLSSVGSSPLALTCTVSDTSTYIWQFNNSTVTEETEFRWVLPYQSIMGGAYRCGFTSVSCDPSTVWSNTLNVISRPILTASAQNNITVLEGDTVSISCNVTRGYPTPLITWYFNNAVLAGSNGQTLTLSSISFSDAGNYTCIAVNDGGYASQTIEIIVIIGIPSSSSVLSPPLMTSSVMDSSSTVQSPLLTTSFTKSLSVTLLSSISTTQSTLSTFPTIPPSQLFTRTPYISSSTSLMITSSSITLSSESPTPSSSSEPPFGDTWITFGAIIGLISFALNLIILFSVIYCFWCCIRRKKSGKVADDKRNLLKNEEGIENSLDDNIKMPKSQSYINEGFKAEDCANEEDSEEEGEEDMKVTVIDTPEDENETTTAEHFVVKLETRHNQKQPSPSLSSSSSSTIAVNQTLDITQEDNPQNYEDVPLLVPPRDSTVLSQTDTNEVVYEKVGLSVRELRQIVSDYEVCSLKENIEESLLAKEFEAIPMNMQLMSQWSEGTYSKNRYRNVIPNKNSAVILSGGSTEVESYINANYMHGYKDTHEGYISAQAPIYETLPDFWQMIWQCNVNTIVMLCKIIERGKNKCAKYWPPPDENDTETYGVYVVRNNYEESFPDYKIVYLSVYSKNEDISKERDICLFLFQGWPDFGVPKNSIGLLQLQESVNMNHTAGPILVHCSAGIGRSGTYISLDLNIKQYNTEGSVDPRGWTHKLREQRGGMIQTLEQYVFLHTAIMDYISKNPKQ